MGTNHDEDFPPGLKGRWRRHIYHLLQTPRTARILLNLLFSVGHRMSYQDLRHLLRDFEKRGWIRCLNAQAQTGRIYVQSHLALPDVDWPLVAGVSRATHRWQLLQTFHAVHWETPEGLTASALRRQLRGNTKMGLSHVLRVLVFFEEHQLVARVGKTAKQGLTCYRLTPFGESIYATITSMHTTPPTGDSGDD